LGAERIVSLFLTRDELMDLTERKQRAKVAEWLAGNGYRFDVAADGWPKVLRSALESRLSPNRKRQPTRQEPDFSAYASP
jgi:hypothetical protein